MPSIGILHQWPMGAFGLNGQKIGKFKIRENTYLGQRARMVLPFSAGSGINIENLVKDSSWYPISEFPWIYGTGYPTWDAEGCRTNNAGYWLKDTPYATQIDKDYILHARVRTHSDPGTGTNSDRIYWLRSSGDVTYSGGDFRLWYHGESSGILDHLVHDSANLKWNQKTATAASLSSGDMLDIFLTTRRSSDSYVLSTTVVNGTVINGDIWSGFPTASAVVTAPPWTSTTKSVYIGGNNGAQSNDCTFIWVAMYALDSPITGHSDFLPYITDMWEIIEPDTNKVYFDLGLALQNNLWLLNRGVGRGVYTGVY